MFTTYVPRSTTTRRLHDGSTPDSVRRFEPHDTDTTSLTKHGDHGELAHRQNFATRAEAGRRERYLKTGEGLDDIKRIVKRKRVA